MQYKASGPWTRLSFAILSFFRIPMAKHRQVVDET